MVPLMNTLAIYEQFRAVLGEDGAKGFAQTLGTMIEEAKNAVTKEDFRQLRESVDSNMSRLDAALTRLADAQARTEARVVAVEEALARLANAQARTEARVGAVEEALARLADAQARTEARMQSLTEAVEKLVIRSDRHEGTLLELKFRDRLPSYLGRFLRKAKVIDASELLDVIEPKLAATAIDDFLRADVVASGTIDGSPMYVVGEISYTADEDDVMRAARRAACLVKAGLPSTALVACEAIAPQTAEYARREGVRVWVNGRLLEAETAA